MYKFVELLNSDNVNCIRNLGIYTCTYHAFNLRTDLFIDLFIEILKNNLPLGNFNVMLFLLVE